MSPPPTTRSQQQTQLLQQQSLIAIFKGQILISISLPYCFSCQHAPDVRDCLAKASWLHQN